MKKTLLFLVAAALTIFAAHAQNYTNAVLSTSNLLGYWRFSPDLPTNSSFGTNTCTFSGNANVGPSGSGPALPGIPTNTALLLDGNGSYVTTTLVGGLNTNGPYANQGSIIAWFKLATLPSIAGRYFVIAGESVYGNDFDFQIETDNNIRFYTDGGSSTATTNALTANDTNRWHFLAGTFIANTSRKIYLDGVLVGSSTPGGHNPAAGGTFSVGDSHVFTGRFFQGAIDEVAIFNRELTGAEVTNLYAGYSSVPVFTPDCTNLTVTLAAAYTNCTVITNYLTNSTIVLNNIIGLWKADGNANDSSGNGNNGNAISVGYETGQFGHAFSFSELPFVENAGARRVDLGPVTQLDSATEFTLSAWVKIPTAADPASTNNWTYLFTHPARLLNPNVTNDVGYGLFISPSVGAPSRRPTYTIGFNDGTEANVGSPSVFPDNQWVHLAVTWSSASGLLQLYRNGVLDGTTSAGFGKTLPTAAQRSPTGTALSAELGVWDFVSDVDGTLARYGGSAAAIDDFRLYNRALTTNEIQLIFNGEPPIISTNLMTNCVPVDAVTTNLDFCSVPPGKLQILNVSPGNVQLAWPSQTNAWYLLEGSDELAPLNWFNVWGPNSGSSSNVIVPDSTTSRPRRFYRLLSTE